MTEPRQLSAPPISEALVDLRAAVTAPIQAFEALGAELHQAYPKLEERRGLRAELRVEQGKVIPPKAEDLGFQGIRVRNSDDSLIAQFRPDGFTLNNLNAYVGGDRLLIEALNLWERFADRMHPASVSRIALRYINRLELPFRVGDEFSRFLTAAPATPLGAPQKVSEFLARVVGHDDEVGATVVSTQQLTTAEPQKPVVIIDIDAYCVGEFSVDRPELESVLRKLRALKNRTFFAFLTDEAVQLYL